MPGVNDAPLVVVREPGRTPLHVAIVDVLEVGRNTSGLLLDDSQVSRRHVELRPSGPNVLVRDLGSTHGTFLDGAAVTDMATLVPGSVLRIGNTTVELVGELGRIGDDLDAHPRSSLERVADQVSSHTTELDVPATANRTLTIVFSDIEESTKLALDLGDTRWYRVLSAHNELIRGALRRHHGAEIKSQGDGFMLTFESARSAIKALVEVQRRLAEAANSDDALCDIRIRAGAHVGEAIMDSTGDLFGRHVHIAARVAAQAQGGEILVSPLVREIVEARGDLSFGEGRVVALKGISDDYVVYPVLWS